MDRPTARERDVATARRERRKELRQQERRERKQSKSAPAPRSRPPALIVVAGIAVVTLIAAGAVPLFLDDDDPPKSGKPGPGAPGNFTFEIVKTYPHDRTSFTQGLEWHDGHLYETTGKKGRSRLRKVALDTGKPVKDHRLSNDLFGEGMTILGDRIIQVTYKAEIGIVYDLATFKELNRFSYPGDGWGLTNDGKRIIMSNGTATLHFMDPKTLERTGSVTVTDNDIPVFYLNELEYVEGEIYANIWKRDKIVRIDPATGRVLGYIDLTSLRARGGISAFAEVLNGIAYDPATKRLFVTGKEWSKLFEIRLVAEKRL